MSVETVNPACKGEAAGQAYEAFPTDVALNRRLAAEQVEAVSRAWIE